ncbi:MAG TPA: FAD-binding oxidoreductase [Candidatus Cybelea sp.]|nr:FAD-binding oxidoreductase [Candidatus Cybelea sp.]
MRTASPPVAPKTAAETAEILARCDRAGDKVSIVGGGTLRGMGFPAERADITLSTKRLSGVVANERADLTVAARAGTAIQSLTALLSTQGQFVPFDAPRPQYATVGGTLAAGWLGPRRHLYGRLRDYVIGSTIVLADGTIARAGGMVVKNVSGYDMSRLYVGSFGTLGIIVQANFKTAPLPKHARLFLAPLPERTRARACAQLESLSMRPAAAFWIDGFHHAVDGDEGPEGRVVVLLEGSEALLERATREVRSALGRAGVPETRVLDAGARESFQRVVDAYVACLGERSVTYRLASPPQASEPNVLRANELARKFEMRAEAIVDVLNGDIILRVNDLDARALGAKIEAFDDALHEIEPRAQVIAGDHPNRIYLRVWGESPPAIAQMQALKARFDPNRTLNPGRFVGGI